MKRHSFRLSHRIQPMVERLKRDIEAQSDPAALRELAKDLLKAWFSEKALTNQAIEAQLKR
jgi:hypothetical protein